MTNMQKHLLSAIDPNGFESCEYFNPCITDKEKADFSYNRFMSEMAWNVERSGIKQAVNDWLSGLALNIAFSNYDILTLGKAWGEISESASEAREDFYIEHWFNNLSASLIELWKSNESMGSIYAQIVAAGFEIDNHQSDLYVKMTPKFLRFCKDRGIKYTVFISQIDRQYWADLPFQFAPFWTKKVEA